ncbi:hypothetical protein IM660_19565 [Ruania alkalisoli]|uniref:Fibronectin type-III domain-containing protein n=1 Tax=Ruania alkalisoli TaxID=2779775 RepID=A0A7M1ST45_9MICO|nr:hypothetical protein [Ruania alkalisoli]QOR70736.1 hypothetical protein IM660_19565 [Ruania alkalisoli]
MRQVRARLAAAAAGVMLVSGAVAIGQVEPTAAAWADSEYVRATVTAGVIQPPQANGCSIGLLSTSATLHWLEPEDPPSDYSYAWELVRPSTGALVGSGSYPSTTGEHQVDASGLVTVAATYSFRIRAVSGDWESAEQTATITTLLGALGVVLLGSCSWD